MPEQAHESLSASDGIPPWPAPSGGFDRMMPRPRQPGAVVLSLVTASLTLVSGSICASLAFETHRVGYIVAAGISFLTAVIWLVRGAQAHLHQAKPH